MSGALATLRGEIGVLARRGSATMAVRFGAIALALLQTAVLARILEPSGYGQYAVAFSIVTILAAPAQLGFPVLALRETAKARQAADWPALNGVMAWSTATGGAVGLVLSGLLLAIVFAAGDRLPALGVSTQLMVFASLLIPVVIIANVLGSVLQGFSHPALGQMQDAVVRPLATVVLLAAAAGLSASGFSPAFAMGLHLAAAAIGLLFAGAFVLRLRPAASRTAAPRLAGSGAWLRSIGPLSALGGLQLINLHVGVLLLGWIGHASDAGVLRVVMQGGTAINAGTYAVGLVAAPAFARLYAAGDLAALRRLSGRCALACLALTLPLVAVIAVWSEDILRLAFGEGFARGALALVLVALGRLLYAAYGCTDVLMTMIGAERDSMRNLAWGAGANILLTVALAPLFGLAGAAAASSLAVGLSSALLWSAARRKLASRAPLPALAPILGARR
ncbi:MAG TPA: oligosaccharide flippase family protein [Phenylobacterium sp.]|nr:oligosaccharide flippase family protein [Phenylobacterium sp.]